MMKSLISIIVPVYKCEKYLKSCVHSILTQTYSNLEVLLIDDGSPDRCPDICDAFAEMDKRVKVFHKDNGGVSSARNMGLDHALGEYICFVDSDDILPQSAISDLWQGITDNYCQYAAGICGILNSNKVKNMICSKKVIDYAENPLELLDYITQSGSYSPYAKIYDANLIRNYGLRYNENLKCSEDALFIRVYLSYCSRIALIPSIVYRYNTDNDGSLSKKFYLDFCDYYAKKMEALEMLVQKLPISECIKRNFIFDRAVHGLYISIHHYLIHCEEKEHSLHLIKKSIDALKEWMNIPGETRTHKKWWGRYADDVQSCNATNIYISFQKELKKEKAVQRVKKFLKKKIRGICK